jgi:hypothetical protein
MSDVVPLVTPHVREVLIDCDGETYLSRGTTREGGEATVLTHAKVSMPLLPLCGPERAIVLACGPMAAMMSARAEQGETPIRARAVHDGSCWEVLSLLSGSADHDAEPQGATR